MHYPIERMGLHVYIEEDLCRRNVWNCYIYIGATYWPLRSRFEQIGCAVIEILAGSPHGADHTSRWHSQTKLRVTKIFAYYSIAFRKTLSSRTYFREIIYLPRAGGSLRHSILLLLHFFFFTEYITYSCTRGYDRVKKPERGGREEGAGDEKLTDRLSCSSSFP